MTSRHAHDSATLPEPASAHDPLADAVVVWHPKLSAYNFGPRHPLAPVRVELAVDLMAAVGLFETDGSGRARLVAPERFSADALLRRHNPAYVEAVATLSDLGVPADGPPAASWGLGAGDTPAFVGMYDASLDVCAAGATAAQLVATGRVRHAFSVAGGLHHAMPERAAGFCVFNDVASAIEVLLDHGVERVAYLDIDVHHGDGVERMYVDDPRVMTVSLHETGERLFPGTGAVGDIGRGAARGTVVNLPLAPGTSGDTWLQVFDEIVGPLLRAYQPEVIVTQLGCDAHVRDPLAHLRLTIDDFGAIYRRLHELAHDVSDGRWVAFGGGGYALADVVPLAWTRAYAEMRGITLPDQIPQQWRHSVEGRQVGSAPRTFSEEPVAVEAAQRRQVAAYAAGTIAAARDLLLVPAGRSHRAGAQ